MIKPVLFNTEEVKATLDGRKTAKRLVVKPPYFVDTPGTPMPMRSAPKGSYVYRQVGTMPYPEFIYNPGDILYVRETFAELCRTDENGYTHYDESFYLYAADNPQIDLYDANGFLLDDQRIKWKPSIHMPKAAARIFLRVTDVRIKKLQDMYLVDFIREGVQLTDKYESNLVTQGICARHAFIDIWNSTLKKDSDCTWMHNPWVWVIEFERISKEDAYNV
ncbi:MAG: hypothetical protein E7L17_14450 [Clostridium sp.]|uniref:hypothetical protein n=1 Tax=Clostridium sp. TaxID=1506 RepID=UPI002908295D|nr:hypothetical protein [Clostridium sp.]MDU7339300.1 hypothetical protein [Clostridium sp.]